MGFTIILRRSGNLSYFRRFLSKMISIPNTNRFLLCSGYVSESSFYSTLDDQLLNDITTFCSNPNSELITIAGRFGYKMGSVNLHNSKAESRYKRFVAKIKRNGITPKAYIAPNKNWHAKIAMILKDENPIACIIGSSNLTQPAYSENLQNDEFSYECDVVIWKQTNFLDKHFQLFTENEMKIDKNDPFSPIHLLINTKLDQPNELKRLKALYKEIMSEGLEEI